VTIELSRVREGDVIWTHGRWVEVLSIRSHFDCYDLRVTDKAADLTFTYRETMDRWVRVA
jgi:hypothetical protein